MNLRALSATFALLLLGGCGVLPSRPNDGVAIARADPAPPLLGRKWPDAEIARVRSVLNTALRSPYFKNAGVALADSSGRLIYGRNETRAFAPASTFKTVVAATALATLGSGTRFTTRLVSLDQPDSAGNIDGLWLIGSGDPVLDPDQLRDGIGALYHAGVRRVDGDIVVDPSAFKTPEQNKDWAPDDFEYDYAAGTSVISLNWNVIQFKVSPTQIGAPPRVSIVPADPDVTIRNAARTGYHTDLAVHRVAPGRNEFTMTGTVGGGEQVFFRPVDGIPLWAGQVVAQMLRQGGIAFDGNIRLGTNPLAEQTLWEHRSPPLRALVRQMLVPSDNHIAEQLLRIVGSRGGDSLTVPGGSESAGALVERAYLQSLGVPTPGLRIVDGSGLAGSDRIAPITVVQLLEAAANSPIGSDYVTAFARAGIEGTVRYHDVGAARGFVRAKSGHIAGVNALCGYIQTRHHGRIAFSFVVNAPGAEDIDAIDDGMDKAIQALYAAL